MASNTFTSVLKEEELKKIVETLQTLIIDLISFISHLTDNIPFSEAQKKRKKLYKSKNDMTINYFIYHKKCNYKTTYLYKMINNTAEIMLSLQYL